ncbi:glycosyltransferase [Listeria booriae]|uniref:glycosyltransferase family 2 protein n=1 Tax=Listeria booriae TaxID=1552123 RepID=UPI0016298A14|nr:glycosyltransferase [Listeria booriae]MBC2159787.1 glycosyltransferase [Listeria booriae]MBC2162117.1 glycosyltransferase [Listeria booriae]MBC2170258.1 glycosyltransferase [Listeria booriae]MBC2195351.1 glycosyltransferase [Listeria booriae]
MNILLPLLTGLSILLIFIYFLYSSLILLLPTYENTEKKAEYLEKEDLTYLFLIPCLNEELVIRKTVQSILSLKYENKMIVVIDDDSTDNTVSLVKGLGIPNVRVIERKKPQAQLGKGESLNDAYGKICRAVKRMHLDPNKIILTVIDGDGRPSANFLEEATHCFRDPRIGAAQARVRITNRSKMLPMLQDIEFYSTVAAIQNSREYTESVGLGGNGQFTRLSALQELGKTPWSKCLLEDFDLGLSILLKGWKSKYLGKAIVHQQGLTSIKRFIRQRTRWVQGNIQSMARLREITKSQKLNGTSKLDIYYFLAQPWINLLGSLIMVISWLMIVIFFKAINWQQGIDTSMENSIAMLIIVSLIFGPGFVWCMYYYGQSKREENATSFFRALLAGLCMPIYNLLTIPSIWLAFWKQARRKDGWAKTERIAE